MFFSRKYKRHRNKATIHQLYEPKRLFLKIGNSTYAKPLFSKEPQLSVSKQLLSRKAHITGVTSHGGDVTHVSSPGFDIGFWLARPNLNR